MTYKIIRSRRKTICISVSTGNIITVHCPLGTSDKRVEEFVESKHDWINKIIAENERKLSYGLDVITYEKIFVGGKKLPLIITNKNAIESEAVYVKDLKKIKQLFISCFAQGFLEIVATLSNKYGFNTSGFRIRSYKSRWGCCDKYGNITFNYLLFMLPPSLQRYVIIHELCHTIYFNHSKEFWKLVSRYEPDYKNLRRQLKSFDFIINLY